MEERIQKVISSAGIMSRRAAEEAIVQGRVTVNGITAHLGEKADPDTDIITVDGKTVQMNGHLVYIALNKPKGYVTTMQDEQGRKTVCDLVSDMPQRIFPVGRLDLNSEGLLLMTNDGDFAYRVMHPSTEIRKVYEVAVTGDAISRAADDLRKPMTIDNVPILPAMVEIVSEANGRAVLHITIHEGKNRQVRKMCKSVGLYVNNLKRIQEGIVSLGKLKSGSWRYLTSEEIDYFLKG